MIPQFTQEEIDLFESAIDFEIAKGHSQISISTGIISLKMQKFQNYLAFYYRSGSFSPSGNVRNYLVAKKGKKLEKIENPHAFI